MARLKETIWQTDFRLGAVRPEAVEQDGAAIIDQSVKECLNTICLSTGQIEQRGGTVYDFETEANRGLSVDLGDGRVFDLHINSDGLALHKPDGTIEVQWTDRDWENVPGKFGTYAFADIDFWAVPSPDADVILIGSRYFPIQALRQGPLGGWGLGELALSSGASGSTGQPFWKYYSGVQIQPSARTGTITVTADDDIFEDGHEGMAIRYVDREILLGTRVSATVMNATVVEELPAAWAITVAATSGYLVGDAVEHSTLGGVGVITDITGSVVTVLTTSKYDGFDGTGKLVAPNASQAISSISAATLPSSALWDMQLFSPIHGYAGWATRHGGRVVLCDFPGAPQAVAFGSSGIVDDFKMGPEDGDGFVEALGADQGGDVLYAVSAEDLVFLTTKGVYYQQTRDQSPITPRTFAPVRFSRIGCARVSPVAVDDGVIFVDAIGSQIYGAVLSGDVYQSWRVQNLTKYHPHLVNSPMALGATQSGGERPEQFIYAVNSDGSAAVCQWDRDDDVLSWRPWSTEGDFVHIYQANGDICAIVDRVIDSVSKRFRERFVTGVHVDCSASVNVSTGNLAGVEGETYIGGTTSYATHLAGETVPVYFEGWDMGDCVIGVDGRPIDANGDKMEYPDYTGFAQVGLSLPFRLCPWPRRSVRTQRGTRTIKKQVKLFITVQSTGPFEVDGQSFGEYRANEDLTAPAPLRSEQFKVSLLGRGAFDSPLVLKPRPGPFRLLKLGYRVTV